MAKPKTNHEAIPGFDAVAESRKWRETTSLLLQSMSREERMAYLSAARTRYLAGANDEEETDQVGRAESCVVREEPPKP